MAVNRESPKLAAIVSHDAGGAEILGSHARRQGLQSLYVLEGPALKIFARKLGDIRTISLEEAVGAADWVLCGTSWQSDLEFQAIKLARALNKPSVAFLDHWVNYPERFERNGERNLPDEIWVGDEFAAELAGRCFTNTPIRLVENPYFQDIREEVMRIRKFWPDTVGGLNVLYVCEPIKEHALRQFGDERYRGYVEEDALRYFLDNLFILGKPVKRILIRPHPSEFANKYDWLKSEYNLPFVFNESRTLIENIGECDVVVGCSSMALIIGLIADKRVISCIPPGGCESGLPQPEIEQLQKLISG